MFPIFAGNSASTGYNLTRSLRFRSSASASLSRTFGSGDRKTWTLSFWVKRGSLGSNQSILVSGPTNTSDSTFGNIGFTSGDAFTFTGYGVTWRTTTQVFRDPSAWYHIVLVWDSTQATAANRARVYVNGSEVTSFSSSFSIALNYDGAVNQAAATYISYAHLSYGGFDGYLAEVNFIGGQGLTPSSFGSTNALTGVWQPARYTGTYGTNGFYLPFTDNSALTTSSNVGLGKDFSGNGNYWTTNNISITAGVTYDSMTDVPTLTSATASNFCVLNPLQASAPALVDGNLNTPSLSAQTVYGTISAKSGKWYWEGKCTARATGVTYVGVENNTYFLSNQAWSTSVFAMQNNSQKYLAGTVTSYGSGFVAGDTIGVALDVTNDTLEFFVNNTSQGQITSVGMAQNNMRPMFQGNTATWEVNFGQRPFAYTPPTGFVALNTYNLPTATLVKGNTVMDATLYTGNGSTQTITNAAGFKPDLVWGKTRSNVNQHIWDDSVRGVSRTIYSNLTNAEANYPGYNVTAFNSNGFTVGDDSAGAYGSNGTGQTYVGWQWQAGQGSSSSNTNGSITSTVSVNASAGFSVVTYASNGTSSATIGHGLGVAPAMIVAKQRSGTGNWCVYHSAISGAPTNILYLNLTNALSGNALQYPAAPTSSVFSVGNGNDTYSSTSGTTYVAYCWTPIAGYSAFGSGVGNGTSDNIFVYLGFRPEFVLFKRTDGVSDWVIIDSARDPYNAAGTLINPNLNGPDYTSGVIQVDFLSNGYKIRGSWGGFTNFIYAAFAENPFKNALAR